MIPNWIKTLADAWGHEMRKFEAKLGNIQGTMGKISDEGPWGAVQCSRQNELPNIDFPDQVQKFHRAWIDLDYQYNKIIYVNFKMRCAAPKKWQIMGLKKWKYYQMRDDVLKQLAVDYHLYE